MDKFDEITVPVPNKCRLCYFYQSETNLSRPPSGKCNLHFEKVVNPEERLCVCIEFLGTTNNEPTKEELNKAPF